MSNTSSPDDNVDNFYDLMDWLWSFRWMAAVFLLVGTLGSAAMWITTPPPTTQYDVTIQIFSGGTATRTADDVADIIGARLPGEHVQLVTERAGNPVVLRTPDRELADQTVEAASAIEGQLIQEAEGLSAELRPLINDNPAALEQYVNLRTFLRGVQSELIHVLDTSITERHVAARAGSAWAFPLIASVVAFFLLAYFWSVWRGWRGSRSGEP